MSSGKAAKEGVHLKTNEIYLVYLKRLKPQQTNPCLINDYSFGNSEGGPGNAILKF